MRATSSAAPQTSRVLPSQRSRNSHCCSQPSSDSAASNTIEKVRIGVTKVLLALTRGKYHRAWVTLRILIAVLALVIAMPAYGQPELERARELFYQGNALREAG